MFREWIWCMRLWLRTSWAAFAESDGLNSSLLQTQHLVLIRHQAALSEECPPLCNEP